MNRHITTASRPGAATNRLVGNVAHIPAVLPVRDLTAAGACGWFRLGPRGDHDRIPEHFDRTDLHSVELWQQFQHVVAHRQHPADTKGFTARPSRSTATKILYEPGATP
ncbi:hypothetical protein GCM10010277_68750 [Streptomyces longisporoflavus]|nr:hypothetical protein GCM10010277_68750 [Streptomyces longisporoflavus]